MAASPKPTPIDDRLHFLLGPSWNGRLQELKATLERLRVEITDTKANIEFHKGERQNLGGLNYTGFIHG